MKILSFSFSEISGSFRGVRREKTTNKIRAEAASIARRFVDLLAEDSIGVRTTVIGERSRTDIQDFLSKELPRLHDGLKKLYPRRELVFGDGLKRLDLLYVPSLENKLGGRTGSTRPLLVPHGMAIWEWKYLEGEFLHQSWYSADILEESGRGLVFPPRKPRFPVPSLPDHFTPDRPSFAIHLEDGSLVSTQKYDAMIPIAAWLLFMNDIRMELWGQIILTLIEHDLRLSRLSDIHRTLAWLEDLQQGVLRKEDGTRYLRTLESLLRGRTPEETRRLRDAATDLAGAVQHNKCLGEEVLAKNSQTITEHLKKQWENLEGPERRYRKEAARYLRPIVGDLHFHLLAGLNALVDNGTSEHIELDPPPMWLRGDSTEEQGHRVNELHIYRLIGDLVRFSFEWPSYRAFGFGIQPPEWQGQTPWSPLPEDHCDNLAPIGKHWRRRFGKRMQLIGRQGTA